MQEFSRQSAGMFVSYIGLESGTSTLTTVAITIATDERSGLRSILFHDSEDVTRFNI